MTNNKTKGKTRYKLNYDLIYGEKCKHNVYIQNCDVCRDKGIGITKEELFGNNSQKTKSSILNEKAQDFSDDIANRSSVEQISDIKEKELEELKKVIKIMEKAEKKEILELRKRLRFTERKLNILENKWTEYILDYEKWLKDKELKQNLNKLFEERK